MRNVSTGLLVCLFSLWAGCSNSTGVNLPDEDVAQSLDLPGQDQGALETDSQTQDDVASDHSELVDLTDPMDVAPDDSPQDVADSASEVLPPLDVLDDGGSLDAVDLMDSHLLDSMESDLSEELVLPSCPDDECNGEETCETCPEDCGECPPACPDGLCNGDETCFTCPLDCPVCPPPCPAYPDWDGLFCGDPLPKAVPGIRLFFSLTWNATDASVCGPSTWKLGNRILLNGTTPDGMPRGRLTGAELYVDVDELLDDEVQYDDTGAQRLTPFAIEVLDSGKNVIWRGRHRLPMQVREYVLTALEDKAGMQAETWMFPFVAAIIGADFEAFSLVVPDLPGATYLRFHRELSAAEKLAAPACAPGPLTLPAYYDQAVGAVTEVPIAGIHQVPVTTFEELTSEVEVIRLAGQADPANAVNVTILSDGYLASDHEEFTQDAAQVANYLMTLEPFASFGNHINVWSVWTPSLEQGASYDCACDFFDSDSENCAVPHDDCSDSLRDNMYGSVFTVRALFAANPFSTGAPTLDMDRNIFPTFLFRIGMAQSLSAPDGTPISGDVAILLTREEKEGAFGFFAASVTTAYKDDPDPFHLAHLATHEFGHAFGLLGDEYSTSSDVCQNFELTPLFPNFSAIPEDGDFPHWEPWVTLTAPWPNTTDQGSADAVGCFVPSPGGGNCKVDGVDVLCRPAKSCKMKTNSGAFCPVCRDHLIHRIFRHVDLIEDAVFSITQESGTTFQLDVGVAEPDVHTRWSIDGNPVQETDAYQPLVLDLATLSPEPHTVTLSVTLTNDWSRVWTDALHEEMSVLVSP